MKMLKKVWKTVSIALSATLLTAAFSSVPAFAATTPPVEWDGTYMRVNQLCTWGQMDLFVFNNTDYYITGFPAGINIDKENVKTGQSMKLSGRTNPVEAVVMGDIDGNGAFSYNDYQKYISQIHTNVLNGAYRAACDMNRDGVVNTRDKLLLKDKLRSTSAQTLMAIWNNKIVDVEPNRTIGDFLYSAGYVSGLNTQGTLYDTNLNNVTKNVSDPLVNGMIYYCNGTMYRIIVYGDVDCDGRVTISDTMQASKIMNGASVTDYEREAADCNMDGSITQADLDEISFLIASKA